MVSHARSNATMSFPHYSKPKRSPDGEEQPQPETRVSKFVDTFKYVPNGTKFEKRTFCKVELHVCIHVTLP